MRVALAIALVASLGGTQAIAQGRTPPPETMDIGDEPGRVSTPETIIEDGPFAGRWFSSGRASRRIRW